MVKLKTCTCSLHQGLSDSSEAFVLIRCVRGASLCQSECFVLHYITHRWAPKSTCLRARTHERAAGCQTHFPTATVSHFLSVMCHLTPTPLWLHRTQNPKTRGAHAKVTHHYTCTHISQPCLPRLTIPHACTLCNVAHIYALAISNDEALCIVWSSIMSHPTLYHGMHPHTHSPNFHTLSHL